MTLLSKEENVPLNSPLIFGEALFDCFPDGREVLGGAPFNVAWNLQAFGLEPVFISRVGDDRQGMTIRDTMISWSMNTDCLQVDPSRPTGRVEIQLTNGEPDFSILPDQAYDHISLNVKGLGETPPFLYHGSLALRCNTNRSTLAELRRDHPCPVFLDVNLRRPWWDRESVLAMIEEATWLKLNEDECRALFPDLDNPEACGGVLLDRYRLEGVFITLGSRGALAIISNEPVRSVTPSAVTEVVDTVGAGDAFSSVLLLGLTLGWPMQTTLERAQEFASGIVGRRGATTMDQDFYDTYCKRWTRQCP